MSKKKHNDWRLPTLKELTTLINNEKYNPVCGLKDIVCGYYWSSTSSSTSTDFAWSVDFFDGSVSYGNKTTSNYVRCVRGGALRLQWAKTSEGVMKWDEAIAYAEKLVTETYYKSNVGCVIR